MTTVFQMIMKKIKKLEAWDVAVFLFYLSAFIIYISSIVCILVELVCPLYTKFFFVGIATGVLAFFMLIASI